tara:strand:+ start:3997 stop:4593 length:597 start_codon:yes stop_codon:yes gene_type:complete
MIKDRNIHYKYKKDFVPVTSFNTFDGQRDGTAATSLLVDTLSQSKLTEVGALGVVGLKQPAAGAVARHLFPLPNYWDVGNDIFIRVIWSEEGTSSGEITYLVTYEELSFGAAPAAGGTPLDVVIAADPHCGVANGLNATTWGKINADSLVADYLVVDVEMDVESAAGLSAVMLGIEWAYLPKMTDGPQFGAAEIPEDA